MIFHRFHWYDLVWFKWQHAAVMDLLFTRARTRTRARAHARARSRSRANYAALVTVAKIITCMSGVIVAVGEVTAIGNAIRAKISLKLHKNAIQG